MARIKSENDVVQMLTRMNEQWQGEFMIISEAIGKRIWWNSSGARIFINGEQIRYEELKKIVWDNRKKINAVKW